MAKVIKSLLISAFNENNYCYIVKSGSNLALVDPSCSKTVLEYLRANNLKPDMIWTTHHHKDHSSGNEDLVKEFPGLKVYGFDDRIPHITDYVKNGDKFKFGSSEVTAYHTPGHTTGCICYLVDGLLFTGDVLFVGGMGRLFEGTKEMMHNSLEILKGLDNSTKVYVGHDYTKSNLSWATKVEPSNQDIKKRLDDLSDPYISTIGDEKKINVFMRTDVQEFAKLAGSHGSVLLGVLREMKNKNVVEFVKG